MTRASADRFHSSAAAAGSGRASRFGLIRVVGIRKTHPADQNPPTLIIQKCLRRVEIKAVIQRAVVAGFIARKPEIAVVVNIFIAESPAR